MMFKITRTIIEDSFVACKKVRISTNCYDVVFVDRYINLHVYNEDRYQARIHFLIQDKWEYVYGYSDDNRKDAFKKARATMNAMYFRHL